MEDWTKKYKFLIAEEATDGTWIDLKCNHDYPSNRHMSDDSDNSEMRALLFRITIEDSEVKTVDILWCNYSRESQETIIVDKGTVDNKIKRFYGSDFGRFITRRDNDLKFMQSINQDVVSVLRIVSYQIGYLISEFFGLEACAAQYKNFSDHEIMQRDGILADDVLMSEIAQDYIKEKVLALNLDTIFFFDEYEEFSSRPLASKLRFIGDEAINVICVVSNRGLDNKTLIALGTQCAIDISKTIIEWLVVLSDEREILAPFIKRESSYMIQSVIQDIYRQMIA
jgi:hypothetical protein